MNKLKIFGIGCAAILVLNLVFFAIGMFNALSFWMVIIIMAIVAYYVVPKMKIESQ
jgi:hypothetical protein